MRRIAVTSETAGGKLSSSGGLAHAPTTQVLGGGFYDASNNVSDESHQFGKVQSNSSLGSAK